MQHIEAVAQIFAKVRRLPASDSDHIKATSAINLQGRGNVTDGDTADN